jgi:hypothetical protein
VGVVCCPEMSVSAINLCCILLQWSEHLLQFFFERLSLLLYLAHSMFSEMINTIIEFTETSFKKRMDYCNEYGLCLK